MTLCKANTKTNTTNLNLYNKFVSQALITPPISVHEARKPYLKRENKVSNTTG